MIEIRGFQRREPIEDTDYVVSSALPAGRMILKDITTGKCELWIGNDDYAGYVVVIGGRGYEFIKSL